MESTSRLLAHARAQIALGLLLILFFAVKANAQSCTTVYTGCSACAYSQYTLVFTSSGWSQRYVSGSEHWCWTEAATPYPYASVTTWHNTYGYIGVTCQAVTPLHPVTTCRPPEPAQPADPNIRNVYRFYYRTASGNVSDHFSIMNYDEGWYWQGEYENVLFRVLLSPIDSNMRALYKCYGSWGDHFADISASCGGHTNQGVYGYISTIPRAGYVPLYRFVRLNPWDFIETTNWDEVVNWQQGGYTTLGYVPQ